MPQNPRGEVDQPAVQNAGRRAGGELERQVLGDVVALPDGEDAALRWGVELADGRVTVLSTLQK
jgi:hypothetical protein